MFSRILSVQRGASMDMRTELLKFGQRPADGESVGPPLLLRAALLPEHIDGELVLPVLVIVQLVD